MKTTIVKCDICGKECFEYKEFIIPRQVNQTIRGGYLNKKLGVWRIVTDRETQICKDCLNKFSLTMPVIEEDP